MCAVSRRQQQLEREEDFVAPRVCCCFCCSLQQLNNEQSARASGRSMCSPAAEAVIHIFIEPEPLTLGVSRQRQRRVALRAAFTRRSAETRQHEAACSTPGRDTRAKWARVDCDLYVRAAQSSSQKAKLSVMDGRAYSSGTVLCK